MTYWGAGNFGIGRCPTCGGTTLNGVCYNTAGHKQSLNDTSITESQISSTSTQNYVSKYINRNLGISMEYPSSWSYSETTDGFVHNITFQPPQKDRTDILYFRIISSADQNIQKRVNLLINFMRNNSSEFSISRNGPISINGMNGYIVSFRKRDDPSSALIISDNIFIQNGGRTLYQLASLGYSHSYDKYLQNINNMFNSFVIYNQIPPPSSSEPGPWRTATEFAIEGTRPPIDW